MRIDELLSKWKDRGFSLKEIEILAEEHGLLKKSSKNNPYVFDADVPRLEAILEQHCAKEKSGREAPGAAGFRANNDEQNKDVSANHNSADEENTDNQDEKNKFEEKSKLRKNVENSGKVSEEQGGGSRKAASDILISWEQAAIDAQRKRTKKAGGIGIVGLSGNGKSWYLTALQQSSQRQSEWKIGITDEKWREKTEGKPQKTEENEMTELNGVCTCKGRGKVEVRTVEVSGEAWRRAFKPDAAIQASPQLCMAINFLRRFVCSCDAFIFLIDTSRTMGFRLSEEYYGVDSAQVNNNDNEGIDRIFQEEIENLWREFISCVALQDSPEDGIQVKRPVAVVLTKADFFNDSSPPPIEKKDYFHLKDLCSLRNMNQYKQKKEETYDARRKRAREFLSVYYNNLYHDIEGMDRKIESAEVFAVSCIGVAAQNDNRISACVEELMDWLARVLWQRRKKERNRLIVKRSALFSIVFFFILAMVGFACAHHLHNQLEYLKEAVEKQDLQAYGKALQDVQNNRFFVAAASYGWMDSAVLEYNRTARQGISMLEDQARQFKNNGNTERAWHLLQKAREHSFLYENEIRGSLPELAQEIVFKKCRQAVLSGDIDVAKNAFEKGLNEIENMDREAVAFKESFAREWINIAEKISAEEPFAALQRLDAVPESVVEAIAGTDAEELYSESAERIQALYGRDLTLSHLRKGEPEKALRELKNPDYSENRFMNEYQHLYDFAQMAQDMVFVENSAKGGSFYIDKYEVSVEEFRSFMERRKSFFSPSRKNELEGLWDKYCKNENSAVIGITFNEAKRFAQSVDKRLPTLQEWRQAHGSSLFPWGDNWESGRTNTRESGKGKSLPPEHRLLSQDHTECGIVGMAGNVSEWVFFAEIGSSGIVIGGNFLFDRSYSSGKNKIPARSGDGKYFVGIRCVLDLEKLESIFEDTSEEVWRD